jgi:hypothetical protein
MTPAVTRAMDRFYARLAQARRQEEARHDMSPMADKFAKSGLFITTADSKRYFKASFEGFAGSGKSFTMGQIARGIWEREGSSSPVIIIDTEESAKYLLPLFVEAGLTEGETLFVSRSRSLVDFEKILELAEEEHAILLIDSVTHLHEEMVAQYLRDNRRKRLEMKDHMVLKPFWKEHFSVPYVRAQCHALFTGRAAWEYEAERDEETGKIKDFVRSGVKMRGDNETAFEPDLLVLMTRCQEMNGNDIKVWREAMVMKSRFDPLDGKVFRNPGFKEFEPVYQFVMTGHAGTHAGRESSMRGLFSDPMQSGAARRREIDKLLGELKGLYDSYIPGATAKEKKLKVDIAFTAFGKRSWEALEDMTLEALRTGYGRAEYIMQHLEELPAEAKELAAWLEKMTADHAAVQALAMGRPTEHDVPMTDGLDEVSNSDSSPQDARSSQGEMHADVQTSEVVTTGQPDALATADAVHRVAVIADEFGLGAAWGEMIRRYPDGITPARLAEIEARLKARAQAS